MLMASSAFTGFVDLRWAEGRKNQCLGKRCLWLSFWFFVHSG